MIVNVYIDVLFLVNFIMDYLLLWFVGFLLKEKLSVLRISIGAGFGAVYAVGMFFTDFALLYTLVFKLLVSLIMVFAAYAPYSLKKFIRQVCVLYAVTFSVGGAGFFLFSYTGLGVMLGAVYSGGVLYLNVPVYLLLLTFVGCFVVLHIAFGIVHRRRLKNSIMYEVIVTLGEKSVCLTGLYDTGNLLKDPVSGSSVILADWEKLRPLFPNHKDLLSAMGCGSVKFIPITFRGVVGSDVSFAFLPDSICLGGRQTNKAYIGVTESKSRLFNGFDAILPNDLLVQEDIKGADFSDNTTDGNYLSSHQSAVL